MSTQSMAYDSPAYRARLTHGFGQNAAGASTNFSKFLCYADMRIFAIHAIAIATGSSAYTQWNGTATTTATKGDSFSVIHVISGAGGTGTYGPFNVNGYDGTSTNTQTATAGIYNRIELAGTGTGAVQAGSNTANGGFVAKAGDTIHIARGTDATAVSAFALEYGIEPGATVSGY